MIANRRKKKKGERERGKKEGKKGKKEERGTRSLRGVGVRPRQ